MISILFYLFILGGHGGAQNALFEESSVMIIVNQKAKQQVSGVATRTSTT